MMHLTAAPTCVEWYAVWTRSRHEDVVRRQLESKQIEVFLPTITTWRVGKNRRKRFERPLFPGYCFVRTDTSRMLDIRTCSGVVSLLSIDGKPIPVPDAELSSIRTLLRSGLKCDPCPLIPDGALVEVVDGPLSGTTGRLEYRNATRATVVVSVDVMGRGARVELDSNDVRLKAA